KLHQPSLVRMQRQSVFRKSLLQHVEHFLSVLPILKAENEIVGKTDLVCLLFLQTTHYRLTPFVVHVVKIDISEQEADQLPSSSTGYVDQLSFIYEHTKSDPYPNQRQDSSVTGAFVDPLSHQASAYWSALAGDVTYPKRAGRRTSKRRASSWPSITW